MISKIFSNLFGSKASISDTLQSLTLTGILYIKQIGAQKTCISQECTMSMSIVNERTYDYNLNIINDDYDSLTGTFIHKIDWKSFYFALNNDRSFKYGTENGNDVLFWEKDKEFFIFYILQDDTNKRNKDQFLKVLNQLISSSEYETELQKLEDIKDYEYISDMKELGSVENFLDSNYSKIETYSNCDQSHQSEIASLVHHLDKKLEISTLYFKKHYPNAICMIKADGVLYRYNKAIDDLEVVTKKGVFQIFKVESFNYYIVIDEADQEITHTCTTISQETNVLFNRKQNLVMWIGKEEGTTAPFNFVFYDTNKIEDVTKLFAMTQYESASHSKFDDLEKENQRWLEDANKSFDESSEDNNDVEMELDPKFQESSSESANKGTTQAYLHDRTFVVRENNTIGVYKTDEEDILTVISCF